MNPIILNLAIALVSGALTVALIARRTWFVRHIRHWRYAWGSGLAALLLIFAVSISGIFVDSLARGIDLAQPMLTLIATALLVFVTLRRVEVTVPSQRRVLVVTAHPDDLELAAGGSIARFADRGHDVTAIVMSDGAVGGDSMTRPGEAAGAAAFLGVRNMTLHKYTDTRLGLEMEQMIATIEARIREFDPDVILTHSANDQHQDHHAVHLAVLRAGRRVPTILAFESPSVTPEFRPVFFVDVADYLDAKIGSIQWHADQMGKPYMGSDRVIGHASHRGSEAKVQYAEGFEVVRALSSTIGDL